MLHLKCSEQDTGDNSKPKIILNLWSHRPAELLQNEITIGEVSILQPPQMQFFSTNLCNKLRQRPIAKQPDLRIKHREIRADVSTE